MDEMKLIGLLRHLNSDKCKLISPNEHVINTASLKLDLKLETVYWLNSVE